jgi:hypothetical protein
MATIRKHAVRRKVQYNINATEISTQRFRFSRLKCILALYKAANKVFQFNTFVLYEYYIPSFETLKHKLQTIPAHFKHHLCP